MCVGLSSLDLIELASYSLVTSLLLVSLVNVFRTFWCFVYRIHKKVSSVRSTYPVSKGNQFCVQWLNEENILDHWEDSLPQPSHLQHPFYTAMVKAEHYFLLYLWYQTYPLIVPLL